MNVQLSSTFYLCIDCDAGALLRDDLRHASGDKGAEKDGSFADVEGGGSIHPQTIQEETRSGRPLPFRHAQ